MKNPFARFFIRWVVCCLGLWIAAGMLGDKVTYGGNIIVIIVAGLILAIVNAIIKPVVVILSLPAILFSLGLFMIIINALMILLVSWLYPSLQVNGFGSAILAGLIIAFVNYLVTAILEERDHEH